MWEALRLAQRNTQRASLPHGNHPLLQHGVTTGQNTHTQPLHKCVQTFPCKISILSACREQLSVLAERAQVNCLPFMSQLNNQITLLQREKEQTAQGESVFNMSSVGARAPSARTQVTITKPWIRERRQETQEGDEMSLETWDEGNIELRADFQSRTGAAAHYLVLKHVDTCVITEVTAGRW